MKKLVHTDPDWEQIQKCSQGDNDEIERLYLRFAPIIFAIGMRYFQNQEVAQDLTHDCFIKILGKLHRYKPNGSFYGWVKRICINQIIDQIRKEKKFKHIEKLNDEDLLWIEESPQEESPPTKIQLDRFIARLPEQKRIIFNLYYIEQLSHRDIAKQLGIKEKTSSSLLYKARQLLTKWIQDEQLEKDY